MQAVSGDAGASPSPHPGRPGWCGPAFQRAHAESSDKSPQGRATPTGHAPNYALQATPTGHALEDCALQATPHRPRPQATALQATSCKATGLAALSLPPACVCPPKLGLRH